MVNEERLHHMIKMAIFDTDQGKECKPMTRMQEKIMFRCVCLEALCQERLALR